jgi:hypothetical protein
MKQTHLSPWQIEELIIDDPAAIGRSRTGKANDDARKHIERCTLCALQKEHLLRQLDLFRDSAVLAASLADRQVPISLPTRPWPFWTLASAAKWGLAFVLLLAAFVPILLEQQQRTVHQKAEHRTADQIARDNLLLEQVDETIAGSVPRPLESLNDLSVDGDSSNHKSATEVSR